MRKLLSRWSHGRGSAANSAVTTKSADTPFDQQSSLGQRTEWTSAPSEKTLLDDRSLKTIDCNKPADLVADKVCHDNKYAKLYLAFYARPKHPDSYHVALHLDMPYESSKHVPIIIKYHCKNILKCINSSSLDGEDNSTATVVKEVWTYERKELQVSEAGGARDMWLLARVCLGYVSKTLIRKHDDTRDVTKVETSMDYKMSCVYVPKDSTPPEFNCVTWVVEAIKALRSENLIFYSPQEATRHVLEVSEDDGMSRTKGMHSAIKLSVGWNWTQVFDVGSKWVQMLKKDDRAGVEVDGRLPEISVDVLLGPVDPLRVQPSEEQISPRNTIAETRVQLAHG